MNNSASHNSNGKGIPSAPIKDKKPSATSKEKRKRLLVAGGFLFLFLLMMFVLSRYFGFEQLVARETELKNFYQKHPWLLLTIAFLIYVVVTGLSIPISTLLSLIYAWFFGFVRATILISFASTAGATIAFLICRYVLRDFVQSKFRGRIAVFNTALDKEGAFFLFMLRLVPVVPFFVVNAVMGLTKMKTVTFWWISQLGMLAGTTVYVYAGSRIPDLETLHDEGVKAVFSPWQLTQLSIAFALVAILPYALKRILRHRRDSRITDPDQ